jgi:hypothetical protein
MSAMILNEGFDVAQHIDKSFGWLAIALIQLLIEFQPQFWMSVISQPNTRPLPT